jgi:hypothetical protein
MKSSTQGSIPRAVWIKGARTINSPSLTELAVGAAVSVGGSAVSVAGIAVGVGGTVVAVEATATVATSVGSDAAGGVEPPLHADRIRTDNRRLAITL